MTTVTTTENVQEGVQHQAGKLVSHFAGYVGFKTIEIGQKTGLISVLAQAGAALSVKELAEEANTDEFYTGVWARAA